MVRDAPCGYDLVIFDLDGTLVDTLPWLLGHLDEITDHFRIRRVLPSEIDALRHLSARELMRHLRVRIWKLPGLSAYVRQLAHAHVRDLRAFPGVFDMLLDTPGRRRADRRGELQQRGDDPRRPRAGAGLYHPDRGLGLPVWEGADFGMPADNIAPPIYM